MRTVNISDLKAQLSAHIQLVRDGEEVLVCDRNKPVARIVLPYARPLRAGAAIGRPWRSHASAEESARLGLVARAPGKCSR